MNEKLCWWAIIISSFSLLISLILLFSKCYITIDWYAVIVSVLALIVTILIGWNIYSAVDLKKQLEKRIEEESVSNRKALKAHSELNSKDFDNIIETLKRSEYYSRKLDDVNCLLINILKKNGIEPNK